MTSQKLERTGYRDPTANNVLVDRYDVVGQHPADPNAQAAKRLIAETERDMESYLRPLEQVHAAGPHEWGIAEGLSVTRGSSGSGLTVSPGVALDVDGRHISLAQGSQAEIAPSPQAPDLTTAGNVLAAGVTLATTGYQNGPYYLVIAFRESWDSSRAAWLHTPWLRLVPDASAKLDGSDGVPLAHLSLGSGGQVTNLSDQGRRLAGIPAGALRLRGSKGSASKVDDADGGEIRARPDGTSAAKRGLTLSVPEKGNSIELKQSTRAPTGATQDGAFTELSIRAGKVTARRDDGTATVQMDANLGNVVVGGQGAEGDVLVLDGNGTLMITLDGDDPNVVVGGQGKGGLVTVKDASRKDTARLRGAGGDLEFSGALRHTADPMNLMIDKAAVETLRKFIGWTPEGIRSPWARTHHLEIAATPSWGVYTATWSVSFTKPRGILALAAVTGYTTNNQAGDYFHAGVKKFEGLTWNKPTSVFGAIGQSVTFEIKLVTANSGAYLSAACLVFAGGP